MSVSAVGPRTNDRTGASVRPSTTVKEQTVQEETVQHAPRTDAQTAAPTPGTEASGTPAAAGTTQQAGKAAKPGKAPKPGKPAGSVEDGKPGKKRKKFELGRRARKLTLAIHVVTSVGWVGMSMSMLVLAVMGWSTNDPAIAKGVYKAMYVFDDTSVTVFSIAAAITGILLSWGTAWGFMLHFWIIVKWVITLFMTIFAWFVIHPIVVKASANTADIDVKNPQPGWPADFLLWSVPLLFVLLTVAAVVSVYKPWGRTARGKRNTPAARRARAAAAAAAAATATATTNGA